MNKYTAVKCSDRMPDKDGDYFVLTQHAMGKGMMVLFWAGFKSRSWNFVEYWLEKNEYLKMTISEQHGQP